ncbi:hypothetical protein BH11BAC6_BH11BAC6_08770 [soil metagenome]
MILKQLLLPSTLILFIAMSVSCKKEVNGNSVPAAVSADASTTVREPVKLGTAANFVLLSKTGITDVFPSVITGNVGSSPITGAAIHLTCTEVSGNIYAVNAAGPLPCSITDPSRLTTAIQDMQTAYTDAAGRLNPRFLNLGAGKVGGHTFVPGLYKWTSHVSISSDIFISGGATDVWIFQIAGTLTVGSAVKVHLSGGAQAKNIFWQTAGYVSLGTTSHFEGIVLSKTAINLKTGASANGRLLAQTAITLQQNTVTRP